MNWTISNRNILPELLDEIQHRGKLSVPVLTKALTDGIKTLQKEQPPVRPASRRGTPGGLVKLRPGGYFVIIPDLHARMDFFNAVMSWTGFSGRTVIEDMADGMAQVICVGDAFHSEARGRERWRRSMDEWISGYKKHENMDMEMLENLGLIEMITSVKAAFPYDFHFLKGNHENIANEHKEGNFPFRKFVNEGEMVKDWVKLFMGNEIFNLIYRWEKLLPLMAEGPDFLVSHSEPGIGLSVNDVINAYESDRVIYNLTWIDNGRAEPDSVYTTLSNFGIDPSLGRVFGGHRPVSGHYSLRQDGRYVQINTPGKWVIAAFTNMEIFAPERDIVCLKDDSF